MLKLGSFYSISSAKENRLRMSQKDMLSKKLLFFFDILDTNKNGAFQSDYFITVVDQIGDQIQKEALIQPV
ncbi:MAG: hypothetical protein RIA69_06165 [Cyclobacteriaceae bacterium]